MAKKVAFIFPGQGSQTVGMCKDLYDKFPTVRNIFAKADTALGFSITKMCFEGPEEDLKLTFNTQPAILTVSVAINEILSENGIMPNIVAGHSLGEYSALVAAKALSFEDAVCIVRKRGQFMQEAVPVGVGSMAAILNLDDEKIKEACANVEARGGVVQPVNFNCPGQVVIAGKKESVDEAIVEIKAMGAKRAIILPVSAPFHSTLMQPVMVRLAESFQTITFSNAIIPVVSNVSANLTTDATEIESLLVKQAATSVLWTDSVKRMADWGVDLFVEVGPGKVLSGFSKKIAKDIPTMNVENIDTLEKVLAYFKEDN